MKTTVFFYIVLTVCVLKLPVTAHTETGFEAFVEDLAENTYRYLTYADSNDDGFLDGWLDTFTPEPGLIFSIGRYDGDFKEFDEFPPIAYTYDVDASHSNRFPRVMADNPTQNSLEIHFELSEQDAAAELTLFLNTHSMGGASGVELFFNGTLHQTIALGESAIEVPVQIAPGTLSVGANVMEIRIPCTSCGKWFVWDSIQLGQKDFADEWHRIEQGEAFDDKCSPEEAGMYMVSHIGACDLGLIDAVTAAQRVGRSLDGFSSKPMQAGAYYRYYATHKAGGEIVLDDKRPSIGAAFLAACLIITNQWAMEQGNSTLAAQAESLLQGIDLGWFWNASFHLFYHDSTKSLQWDHFSDEGRLISFMAYALSQISWDDLTHNLQALARPSLWYDISDTATSDTTTGPEDILVDDVSWDGAMFSYAAPSLFIDEEKSSYLTKTLNPAVSAQMAYAEQMGYTIDGETVWGISDCFNSNEFYCSEYQGAPPTNASFSGSNPFESCPGLITPHAAAMAMLSSRHLEALANLAHLSTHPGLYHSEYGFKDSVDVASGKVTERILTLDQLWLFLSLVNYEKQTLYRYLYKDPRIRRAHIALYREGSITGGVGLDDAIAGLQILAGQTGAGEQAAWFADADANCKVEYEDILYILQKMSEFR